MSRTNKGYVLPVPTGGMNLKDNPVGMAPNYASWLENVFADSNGIKVRNGMTYFASLSITDQAKIIATYPGATDTIFALTYDTGTSNYKAYDITAGGVVAPNTVVNYFGSTTWFTSFFNGYLYIFDAASAAATGGAKYSGSAWSAIGYTYYDAAFRPGGAFVYKGRHYLIDRLTLKYEYTDVDQVTGAITHEVNLSSIFSNGGTLAWGTTFSSQDGVTNSVYVAFGSTTGEVLIYSGDYPDSSTWSLVQRFVIGKPATVYPNAFNLSIPLQGDTLVNTALGLVSLRSLFLNGLGAVYSTNVSSMINTLWTSLIAANAGAYNWSGIFWPDKNKLIIYTGPYITNTGSTNTSGGVRGGFLVMNTVTGAWSTYSVKSKTGINKLIYANGEIYFNHVGALDKVVHKFEEAGTNKDRISGSNTAYGFGILSSWNAPQTQITNQKTNAWQPIINTDYLAVSNPGSYGIAVSKDFSTSTEIDLTPNKESAKYPVTGFSKEVFSVGEEATFIQYRLVGTTPTGTSLKGFTLFSINSSYEDGVNTI